MAGQTPGHGVVGGTHLNIVGPDGLQLRGGGRRLHFRQGGVAQVGGPPHEEAPQVLLADAANGVDVRAAAVVLYHARPASPRERASKGHQDGTRGRQGVISWVAMYTQNRVRWESITTEWRSGQTSVQGLSRQP
jgi:hypothetical protein